MGLSFFETMGGEVVDSRGETRAMDFEIKVEASHLAHFLRTGHARITGVVRVPPWTEGAAMEGRLQIEPARRRLVYSFGFASDIGDRLRFEGKKSLSYTPWGFVKSMTVLRGALLKDGEVVAEGALRFDLKDIVSFAGSWRPWSSFARAGLPDHSAGAHRTSGISESRLASVIALGEAVIPPGRAVPRVDDVTRDRLDELLARFPRSVRSGYGRLAGALDVLARTRRGRPFAALDVDDRRRLIEWVDDSGALGRAGVAALLTPLKAAHFGRRDYLDAIGAPTFEHTVREKSPRYMKNVTPAEALEPVTEIPADVVVVGTGAGGGPVAALLAERGLAVAVVEEGRYHTRAAFSGDPTRRAERFYRDSGLTFTVGNLPMAIPTGRLVGGTTAINSGTCFATPDSILLEWRTVHGLPDDFTPANFAPFLDSVMTELQVAPAGERWLGDIAKIIGDGADARGVSHGPLPRNAPDCDGQGECPCGCPTDARRSTNVSYVPRALRAGAHVFTGLPVTRILRRGSRVVGVEARGSDRHGARRLLRINARAVVVSCGTLASPLLLSSNGLASPQLGRNLSVHPAIATYVRSERVEEPWRAIPQSYTIEGLMDERVRYEGAWAPPQLAVMALPLMGEELTRWMDGANHMAHYGFMVRDRNVGVVTRGPGGRPFIRYSAGRDLLSRFRDGTSRLSELLLRGGADEVLTGIRGVGLVRTVAEARAIARLPLKASRFAAMGFHPLGTCRMGPDRKRGVVDFEHRVHGTDNLYVIDGASVPTSLGVNPQITIMAMAERAAGLLGRRLD